MKNFIFERLFSSLICWFVAGLMYIFIPLLAIGLGAQVVMPGVSNISKFYEPVLLLLFPLACVFITIILIIVEKGSALVKSKWPQNWWRPGKKLGAPVVGNVVFKEKMQDECITQLITLGSISIAIGLSAILSNLLSGAVANGAITPAYDIGKDVVIGVVLWVAAGAWEAFR